MEEKALDDKVYRDDFSTLQINLKQKIKIVTETPIANTTNKHFDKHPQKNYFSVVREATRSRLRVSTKKGYKYLFLSCLLKQYYKCLFSIWVVRKMLIVSKEKILKLQSFKCY